jgi:hypothetical protein
VSRAEGPSGAVVGNYVLFAGGTFYPSYTDAYNKSLTKTTTTKLSISRMYSAGTSVGNYALFAGGFDSSYRDLDVVDVYNSSLTRSTASTPLSQPRS